MTKLRTEAAKLLKEYFNIEPDVAEVMFDNGFLNELKVRDALIRLEYNKKLEPKEKIRLREKLARKYCVSISLVEKIVLTKQELYQF